jgi:hypothetical protein
MKIVLTEEQNTMLVKALTEETALELYTPKLYKIGQFGNTQYKSRNNTNQKLKKFHRIFFKFSQPFNEGVKKKK